MESEQSRKLIGACSRRDRSAVPNRWRLPVEALPRDSTMPLNISTDASPCPSSAQSSRCSALIGGEPARTNAMVPLSPNIDTRFVEAGSSQRNCFLVLFWSTNTKRGLSDSRSKKIWVLGPGLCHICGTVYFSLPYTTTHKQRPGCS